MRNKISKEEEISERVENLAWYIIESRSTVREAAERFGVGKSTVHLDLTDRLHKIAPCLVDSVRKVLDRNKAERHIRGGEATRKKYSSSKE